MTPLAVLHVICPEPATARGGADLHVRDLAVEQRGRGTDAQVLVLGDRGFARAVAAAGPRAWAVPAVRAPARIAAFARGGNGARRIVHAHGYEADYAAAAGVALGGGTLVMTAHGFLRTDPRMRLMTWLDVQSMRGAAMLIAAGADQADELRGRFPRVEHVPNGTRAPARPRRPATRRLAAIGFVGRMSVEKRPQHVLDVVRTLTLRGVECPAHLFGGGPLLDLVRSQAAAMEGVYVHGFADDVDRIYDAIDVLVLPSDRESSPRVVLEAMSRGVPVVACAVGDVPDILNGGTCGLLVDRDDADALALACERLLRDPVLRARIAERAAARWARYYRLDAMADRVQEIYARTVGP
jgi:glycosyltransferase involved in cell wall biosynthesis